MVGLRSEAVGVGVEGVVTPTGCVRPVACAAMPHKLQVAFLLTVAPPLVGLLKAAEALRRVWTWCHGSRSRRLALRVAEVHAAALALVAAALAHHVYLDRGGMPLLEPFLRFEPPSIGQVYDANGDVIVELAREYRKVIPYPELPLVLRQAILAAEDKNFFAHSGLDYSALPRVLVKIGARSLAAARRSREPDELPSDVLVFAQGGSTVTQQLVRGYFLQHLTSQENGHLLLTDTWVTQLGARLLGIPATNKLVRKVEEARLSVWLEEELTGHFGSRRRAKEEILARYASLVYLGNGRYGFATGAEFYLGRALDSLGPADAADAALLAGITKSPADYSPSRTNVAKPLRRRNEILSLMARRGFLTWAQARRAQQAPVRLAARGKLKTEAPAAVENVFSELKALDDGRMRVEHFFEGRIHVHSTIDNRIQRIVNEALENGLRSYEERHPESRGIIQGSVVVLANADARILAEAGGRQVFRDRYTSYSDYNRVTESRRQPGSALKPVVYLAAFRRGSKLDMGVWDAPVSVPMGGGRPAKWISNYDQKFKGLIPIRQALAESRNAATIWIAKQVGLPYVLETARELGIRSPLQPYITTALGASEVDLLELANLYRAMAAGTLAEPHVLDRVTDGAGMVLFQHEHPSRLMIADRPYLAMIQEGLRGVVRLRGGTAHSLDSEGFPVPVMGKTGTTSNFRDALFVGSSFGPAGITVAVRIGYDDNRELGDKETGGRAALPVFKEVMLRVYQDGLRGPPPPFPESIEDHIDDYVARQLRRLAAPRGEARARAGSELPGDAEVLPSSIKGAAEQPAPAPGTQDHALGDEGGDGHGEAGVATPPSGGGHESSGRPSTE
jgi:penicillin-binding protein 1A